MHLLMPVFRVPYLLVIRSVKTLRKELMNKMIQECEYALHTPVVMTAISGLPHKATYFHKHLALIRGGTLSCNGLAAVFLVIFLIMFGYSMCLSSLFLNLTPCSGSSTNKFIESGA